MKNYKNDSKMIIVEGTDRSGKTELIKEIKKQTEYAHIVWDRGPIGWLAYGEIHNRDRELMKNYKEIEKQLASFDNVLIIYLSCDTDELIRRSKNTNHEILDYDVHKAIYKIWFNESLFENKISIDSTCLTPKEIASDLIKEGWI